MFLFCNPRSTSPSDSTEDSNNSNDNPFEGFALPKLSLPNRNSVEHAFIPIELEGKEVITKDDSPSNFSSTPSLLPVSPIPTPVASPVSILTSEASEQKTKKEEEDKDFWRIFVVAAYIFSILWAMVSSQQSRIRSIVADTQEAYLPHPDELGEEFQMPTDFSLKVPLGEVNLPRISSQEAFSALLVEKKEMIATYDKKLSELKAVLDSIDAMESFEEQKEKWIQEFTNLA